MENLIALQVPLSDPDDLKIVFDEIGAADQLTVLRQFDGAAMLHGILAISAVTLPMVRLWIRMRAASRKEYRVVVNGIELSGYDAGEVEQILDKLNELSAAGSESTSNAGHGTD